MLKRGRKGINLTGLHFGLLTPILFLGTIGRNGHWLCICKCGNFSKVTTTSLRSGKTKSCGCKAKARSDYLIGEKFGKLTVIGKTDKSDRRNGIIWKCKCECGNEKEIATSLLKRNLRKSCGKCGHNSFSCTKAKNACKRIYPDYTYETMTRGKRNSHLLTDTYIKSLLTSHSPLSFKDIPMELVEVTRLQIKLKREIKHEKDRH